MSGQHTLARKNTYPRYIKKSMTMRRQFNFHQGHIVYDPVAMMKYKSEVPG
jgi:hypothetical protein